MKVFNWEALKKQEQTTAFVMDIFMVALIMVNLGFIIFDWHFGFAFFRNFLKSVVPDFYQFYSTKVHPNFLLYDLFFVTIYISELSVQWILAIKRKTYYRWFFFPFVHWYDVLGCIPVGAFRWLRILRVVTITVRLHKLEVIDLTQTYIYQLIHKYYKVAMEEISDRVVVNILESVQKEIELGSPVTDQMITEIIKPHQETISEWVSHRIRKVTDHNYTLYKDDIKQYVENVVGEAVNQNREVRNIKHIPILGNQISTALEQSVSDITLSVINGLVQDLASDKNSRFIKEVTDILFEAFLVQEEDPKLNEVTRDVFIRAVDLVKQQVEIKQWRLREELQRARQQAQAEMATA